jgi:predicted transcriptional regulator
MLGAENERRVQMRKQKLTVSLSPQTVQKAKALAAKRSTSVSELLTRRIEAFVDPDEAYANAHRAALELMERGFHMGGTHSLVRQNLHSRC